MLGITGATGRQLKNYLTNQYQSVCINNCFSSYPQVIFGVPQGSLLGPSLFLISINDIALFVHSSTVLMFADDTECNRNILDDPDQHLQDDINALASWSLILEV